MPEVSGHLLGCQPCAVCCWPAVPKGSVCLWPLREGGCSEPASHSACTGHTLVKWLSHANLCSGSWVGAWLGQAMLKVRSQLEELPDVGGEGG